MTGTEFAQKCVSFINFLRTVIVFCFVESIRVRMDFVHQLPVAFLDFLHVCGNTDSKNPAGL